MPSCYYTDPVPCFETDLLNGIECNFTRATPLIGCIKLSGEKEGKNRQGSIPKLPQNLAA